MNELTEIKKYGINELHAAAADDKWAVRDEVSRRHAIAAKKLAKLQKEVAELESLFEFVSKL